ncbi:Hypothetical predicted protein [Mytilus galloprovincialis]|uniref:SRCR domain-containing protein n=1 Tax=Mytilus galloprovincialis TaxID=29158 RepID=A0A8B6CJR9_MYTGA|nr:Hypothetical predicted protein [Mytilus galloprovincialis]
MAQSATTSRSIPEVLASSNNELNVSDNSDSDIENDESDIENTCDTIQARAREFYSTSVIQDQSENTCSLNQNDELEDPSRLRINALFANDCNCTKKFFTKLSTFREQAYDVSLSVCEFTKAERDIYLLSKLENLEITDSVFRGEKRERKRYRYSFQGVEICEFTWRNIYNIGRSEFKSLKQHLNANGVTPRSHGLSGRKSNHGHSFEVIENTIKFIKRYADEFGLPLPAAPRATDNTPPILLPCSESKKYVHSKYVSSCVNSEQQYVQLTVFKEVWNACVPHIQFMKPKTDLCKTCFQLREDISGSISEDAKLVTTQKLIDHIQSARTEREYYKLCTQRSRDELKLAESPIGKYNTPCSKNFENVHYTFDFSQYVNLPHSSQQVGALYFLTPRKVQIFGVCDENFPMQTNYLIDEQQTIGENGSRTHGPNAVLSMLHHYLHGKNSLYDSQRMRQSTREREENNGNENPEGLPFEVKDLDTQSADVFSSLLVKEGYHHYEARVMLAGEQGLGKTTIARYLVGRGPTNIRNSTDGIDIYNGLSFFDRETYEWVQGKQDFTLSEIAISRLLRQEEDTSADLHLNKMNLMEVEEELSDNESSYIIRDNPLPDQSDKTQNKYSNNDNDVDRSITNIGMSLENTPMEALPVFSNDTTEENPKRDNIRIALQGDPYFCKKDKVECPNAGGLRITEGFAENQGRLEVYYKGEWGTVCDNQFTNVDAEVACKQLGYCSGLMIPPHKVDDGIGTIWLNNVNCSGSESGLLNCTFNTDASNCRHCGLRITDGFAGNQGRLEIKNKGEWGTLCDDQFENVDAEVAYRQLGYWLVLRLKLPSTKVNDGIGTIWLNNVNCSGSESYLLNCTYNYDTSRCRHYHDVGIHCFLNCSTENEGDMCITDGFAKNQGRLEIYYKDEWGTLCDNEFDNVDAEVACRQFGYCSGLKLPSNKVNDGIGTIWFNNVNCVGSESNLVNCTYNHDISSCRHYHDVGIHCFLNCSTEEGGDLRLIKGYAKNQGQLEINYKGEWGTVCDNQFENVDAKVACRLLGYWCVLHLERDTKCTFYFKL